MVHLRDYAKEVQFPYFGNMVQICCSANMVQLSCYVNIALVVRAWYSFVIWQMWYSLLTNVNTVQHSDCANIAELGYFANMVQFFLLLFFFQSSFFPFEVV